jgi:putative tryptophan/tyrosine transport system substrate-binding protein
VSATLVASLAQPGGNLTGFSSFAVELNPKRFELLSELVPRAKVIALLVNPSSPNTESIIIRDTRKRPAQGVQLPILKARPELEGVVGSG